MVRFGGPAGGRSRRRSGDRDGTEVRVAVMAVCWTLRACCGAGLRGCGSARAVTAVEIVPLRRVALAFAVRLCARRWPVLPRSGAGRLAGSLVAIGRSLTAALGAWGLSSSRRAGAGIRRAGPSRPRAAQGRRLTAGPS